MHNVLKLAIYILEGLFACGLFGSVLVILLSMVDDVEVFVGSSHAPSTSESEQPNLSGVPTALSH
jgi:hypothetical protein